MGTRPGSIDSFGLSEAVGAAVRSCRSSCDLMTSEESRDRPRPRARRRSAPADRAEHAAENGETARRSGDDSNGSAIGGPSGARGRRRSSRRRERRVERERAREERAISELGEVSEEDLAPSGRDFVADALAAGARIVPSQDIDERDIDSDAMRVVSRLVRRGYEAYLVGGCVRDLLLGRQPKDFDVATEAHPRQIKRLFRNGRIIGRRFKLVHVVYGRHVIETSTFRAVPEGSGPDDGSGDAPVEVAGSEELLIVDDNRFGTAAEDARRRDFTINALFLDPLEGRIFDFTRGLEDLDARLLRTIGEPRIRMAEDPVRILRAVKFATRLGFEIEEHTWEAMCALAPALERSTTPRVVEEILRLLLSGHAREAFEMLERCGALGTVLPELEDFIDSDASGEREELQWNLLGELDARIARGESPRISDGLAYLLLPQFEEALARAERDQAPSDSLAMAVAEECVQALSGATRVSRRDLGRAKRLMANQRRFELKPSKRFRPLLFARSPEFDESLALYRDARRARDESLELAETWEARAREAADVPEGELERLRKRRRRRRPRRRSSTARGSQAG